MTQQCKYDDQLLDYLYGELDEPARKLFAEHLQSCSACAAQVESLGRVRKEYQNRPPIEPAGEAMQRMTALLMQAAASSHAPAAAAAVAAQDGGKVLQFRSRGLRRILFHPAGGVMAVAAAALFWVVFRAQPGAHTGTSGPTSFRTMEDVATETAAPAVPVATPAAPAAVAADPAAPVDKSVPAGAADHAAEGSDELKVAKGGNGLLADGLSRDGKTGRGDAPGKDKASAVKADKDDDFGGLRAKSRPAKEPEVIGAEKLSEEKPKAAAKPVLAAQAVPAKPLERYNTTPAAKPSAGLALELRTPAVAAPAASKGAAAPSGNGPFAAKNADPAPRALDDRVYAKAEKKVAGNDAERWAQPPPPPPAVYSSPSPTPPPAAAPAPVQSPASPAPESSRDEDNSVSSAIARTREQRQQKVVEALANQELGSLGAGGTAGAPSPLQSGDNHYGQRHASAPKTDSAAPRSGAFAQEPAESEAAPTATAPSRATGVSGNRDESAAALAAAKEQLHRGQCAEANTALAKLERAQPTLPGLAELRAQWQNTCAPPPVQQLERRMNNESFEAPAPAAASRSASKLRVASPAPPPKAPARAKAASKPVPERSKAVDTAVQ